MVTQKSDYDRTGSTSTYQPGQFGILDLLILTTVVGACLAIVLLPIQAPLAVFKALAISIVLLVYFLRATRHRQHDKRVGMMIPFISFGPLFIRNIWEFFHADRYPRIVIGYVPLILSLAFLLCGLWFGIRAVQALCERPLKIRDPNDKSVTPR